MKKVKKNNKPLITLIVGLLLCGCLIGYSVYGFNQYKKQIDESYQEFLEEKAEKIKKCEEDIESKNQLITTKEAEIEKLDRDVTLLQRAKTDEFMNSRGFSDKYYELEDQITDKRKEQTKKRQEIATLKTEILKLKTEKSSIEEEHGNHYYSRPVYKGFNPYISLGLGIIVFIVTLVISSAQKLVKEATSDLSFSEYEEINESLLSNADINDGSLLKKELFEKLESLLLASSSGDYDTIRKLCTKNMAKSYIDEVELLKKHNKKLFIKDVEERGSKIVSVFKNAHNTKVVVVQKIKLFNYTKSLSTNEIVLGDNKKKMEQAFKLTFVKEFGKGHNVKKCPNCNANIKDATKVACDYCGTVFDNSNYDW